MLGPRHRLARLHDASARSCRPLLPRHFQLEPSRTTLNMTFLALNLATTSTAWPRGTARSRGTCSPATRSTRSPTASTPPPGPAAVPGPLRPPHPRLAAGQLQPPLRPEHLPRRDLGRRTRRPSRRLLDYVNRQTTPGMDPDVSDDRLRPPGHGLQAGRPALLRTSSGCDGIAARPAPSKSSTPARRTRRTRAART